MQLRGWQAGTPLASCQVTVMGQGGFSRENDLPPTLGSQGSLAESGACCQVQQRGSCAECLPSGVIGQGAMQPSGGRKSSSRSESTAIRSPM